MHGHPRSQRRGWRRRRPRRRSGDARYRRARPATLVDRVHAILLTGGSAFGLEAAGGVMRYLDEHGVGYELVSVRVPIVAAAAIFDLLIGDPRARPDDGAGYSACEAAGDDPATGPVGAGTGASVAKGGDGSQIAPGGLGIATAQAGRATVAAVMVVNSVGGIWDDNRHQWVAEFSAWDRSSALVPGTNTTIGAIVTDAALTKEQANRVATVAHDGIRARSVRHTRCMTATRSSASRPGPSRLRTTRSRRSPPTSSRARSLTASGASGYELAGERRSSGTPATLESRSPCTSWRPQRASHQVASAFNAPQNAERLRKGVCSC